MSRLPIHPYSDFLHAHFGRPVRKISVDAGFSCPNRSASGSGGCSYCSTSSFTPPTADPLRPVGEQLRAGIERARRRRPDAGWIAYFQPRSNTHAPPDVLGRLYAEALAVEGVVGLAIGTRPDCLPEPALDLLRELSAQTYLQLEIGLQTTNDQTLERIGRGHDTATFADAVERAAGLRIGAHIILGLPGDTRDDAIGTADLLARLGVDLVKIHNLHLVQGTRLAEEHARTPLPLLSLEEYAVRVVAVLRRLPRTVAIERLWGSAPHELVVAPAWCHDGNVIRQAIEREMMRLGAKQGDQASASATACES